MTISHSRAKHGKPLVDGEYRNINEAFLWFADVLFDGLLNEDRNKEMPLPVRAVERLKKRVTAANLCSCI